MSDSIFTKIIRREIPAEIVHEDDLCIAIKDIHPQAPGHFLVIPKKPVERLGATRDADQALLGHLLGVARQVAFQQGLAAGGYRVVINNGPHAGEVVPHLHLHVLGGARLTDNFGVG